MMMTMMIAQRDRCLLAEAWAARARVTRAVCR